MFTYNILNLWGGILVGNRDDTCVFLIEMIRFEVKLVHNRNIIERGLT